jgi:hypothetical protein
VPLKVLAENSIYDVNLGAHDHLVHFVFIWNIFLCFGIMYKEKSGNPDLDDDKRASIVDDVIHHKYSGGRSVLV